MILSTISAKVWQVAVVALWVLLLIACTGWGVSAWRLKHAVSKRAEISAERHEWRRAAIGYEYANGAWAALAKQRADRIAADGRKADSAAADAAKLVRAAKVEARAATARLAEYQRRPRTTTCSAALATLDAACPELKGY